MAKVTREQLLTRSYQDPKNYPYGFARSGDFSISESKALSQYGNLICALLDGELDCSCKEDKGLLAVALGEKAPESVAERAWSKYQMRVNRPKAGSIYGNKPNHTDEKISRSSVDEDDLDDSPLDDDVVLDDED